VLLTTVAVAAGCSQAPRGQRASAPAPPPPAVPAPGVLVPPPTGFQTFTNGLAPIPGHPPISVSGVVKSVDRAVGIVTFEDGRMVQLTSGSTVQTTVGTPDLKPGELVVVRNAVPIGVWSEGRVKPMRMATVADVDDLNRLVRFVDGTTVRVTPSTLIHRGISGSPMELADLRPGDELAIVAAETPATTGMPPTTGTEATAPSALPRQAVSPAPIDASELMVFRGTAGLAPR